MKVQLAATFYTMVRDVMPQIRDLDELRQEMADLDVDVFQRKVAPEKLLPTQTEVDDAKALAAFENSQNPIIVDSGMYIVDGHHRWWGSMISHASRVDTLQIMMKFPELVDKLIDIFPPETDS